MLSSQRPAMLGDHSSNSIEHEDGIQTINERGRLPMTVDTKYHQHNRAMQPQEAKTVGESTHTVPRNYRFPK